MYLGVHLWVTLSTVTCIYVPDIKSLGIDNVLYTYNDDKATAPVDDDDEDNDTFS